jgi:hypothetical protein
MLLVSRNCNSEGKAEHCAHKLCVGRPWHVQHTHVAHAMGGYQETQRNAGRKHRDSRNQRNTPKRKASLTTQTSIMLHATTTPTL